MAAETIVVAIFGTLIFTTIAAIFYFTIRLYYLQRDMEPL